ncbi:MAG: aquaporin [Gemmatimonadaceae bacterium]|nr:aquaporin [Gemmatimonadaceae bacterium]
MTPTPVRALVAECLATFLFVFLGGAVALHARNPESGIGLLEVALAHGLALAVATGALAAAAVQANPALSIALLAAGRSTPSRTALAVAGQLLGAVAAALLLKGLFPAMLWEAARGTRPVVALDLSMAQAFTIEAIATGALTLVAMARRTDAADRRVANGGDALVTGAAFTVGLLAVTPFTGGGLNPARTLAPMIVTGTFEGALLFVTAPVSGALVAAVLHRLLVPRESPPTS